MFRAQTKSDIRLQREVLDELKWDTRVKHTDVGVTVTAGVVTLTGRVGSWPARLAAQEAAHRVEGVLDVANDLTVELPGSAAHTDTDIARAVRHALEWDTLVPDERIQSTVSGGVVTLEGTLEHWAQRDDADRAVRNLAGVLELRNRITIAPSAVAAQAVRAAIQEALSRRADRLSAKVGIAVVDGHVRLDGTVLSVAERDAIAGAVRGTPGVTDLDNRILVEP